MSSEQIETVDYLANIGVAVDRQLPRVLIDSGRAVEGESPVSPHVGDDSRWFVLDEHFSVVVDGDDKMIGSVASNRFFVVRGSQVIDLSRGAFEAVFPEQGELTLRSGELEMYNYPGPTEFHWYVTIEFDVVIEFGLVSNSD